MALRETPVPAALEQFLASGLDDVLARPVAGAAERRALALFASVATTVPAYRAFLAEHGVDPAGKFVIEAREDAARDHYLAIAVELAPGVSATEEIRDGITQSIAAQLRRLNSEFTHYTPLEHQLPRVTLHHIGDPEYFPPGVKHRYSR